MPAPKPRKKLTATEKDKAKEIRRTTIAFKQELVAEIDRTATEERTDRSNLLNQILWVIFLCPETAPKILARKEEEDAYNINTAQIIQEALIFYFEYAQNPEIKQQAALTHRYPRQMLEYLVELGWAKYQADNKF